MNVKKVENWRKPSSHCNTSSLSHNTTKSQGINLNTGTFIVPPVAIPGNCVADFYKFVTHLWEKQKVNGHYSTRPQGFTSNTPSHIKTNNNYKKKNISSSDMDTTSVASESTITTDTVVSADTSVNVGKSRRARQRLRRANAKAHAPVKSDVQIAPVHVPVKVPDLPLKAISLTKNPEFVVSKIRALGDRDKVREVVEKAVSSPGLHYAIPELNKADQRFRLLTSLQKNLNISIPDTVKLLMNFELSDDISILGPITVVLDHYKFGSNTMLTQLEPVVHAIVEDLTDRFSSDSSTSD